MKLAFVVGKVVLNKKDAAFEGDRWLLASPVQKDNLQAQKYCISGRPNLVVYDSLGCREGDLIGYVEGAEAAVAFKRPTPVDAYSVAIIDRVNYKPL